MLSAIVFTPLLAAFLLFFVTKEQEEVMRRMALGASLFTFLLSLGLLVDFDPQIGDFQFVEKTTWIQEFGIQYYLGVDGISLFLVLLTTLLTPIVILASWEEIHRRVREYLFFFLLLETGMLGAFVALDLFLFYVFWEAMLIPMYFIIGVWGGPRRIYAALKFVLYTMAGSLLMLVAILYLAYLHGGQKGEVTFDLLRLYELAIPVQAQLWLFAAFALSFAIKVPLFPFHTWLPDAHVEAPTGGIGYPGRCTPEDGHIWLCPLRHPPLPRCRQRSNTGHDGACGHWHCLRGPGSDGAAGPKETCCLLVRQPSGFCRAWPLCPERPGD